MMGNGSGDEGHKKKHWFKRKQATKWGCGLLHRHSKPCGARPTNFVSERKKGMRLLKHAVVLSLVEGRKSRQSTVAVCLAVQASLLTPLVPGVTLTPSM